MIKKFLCRKGNYHSFGMPVPLEHILTGVDNISHTTITLFPCLNCNICVEFGDNSQLLTLDARNYFIEQLSEEDKEIVLSSDPRVDEILDSKGGLFKYFLLTSGEKLRTPWYKNPFTYIGFVVGFLIAFAVGSVV